MRIVSLLPSATEIVCALGLSESLVGVTHECDYPLSVAGKPRLTASRISHETMTSIEIDHAVRTQLDGHGSIYDLATARRWPDRARPGADQARCLRGGIRRVERAIRDISAVAMFWR